MNSTTVLELVAALVETYANGLADYTTWRRKRLSQNRYHGRGRRVPPCALSASLATSGPQIRETFDVAWSALGPEISTGDSSCRNSLWAQLSRLRERFHGLRRAATSTTPRAQIDVAEMLKVSETVRISSLQALVGQYQRLAFGRPVPKTLVIPRPKMVPQEEEWQEEESPKQPDSVDSGLALFRRKMAPYQSSDRQEKDSRLSRVRGSTGPSPSTTSSLRKTSLGRHDRTLESVSEDTRESSFDCHRSEGSLPSDSGFGSGRGSDVDSLTPTRSRNADDELAGAKDSSGGAFCPAAAKLQDDSQRPVPSRDFCNCAYRWSTAGDRKSMTLREGFIFTPRFLAKSHMGGPSTYGCVFCFSSTGKTVRLEGISQLGHHIDSSHTQWQIVHDGDLRTTSKLGAVLM